LLKAARALFAHIFARAKIHNNTGALPQPPSGEQCSPEPQRADEYVRAIDAFAKINFHAKVFSLTPLTQYILVPRDFACISHGIKRLFFAQHTIPYHHPLLIFVLFANIHQLSHLK
jgi:hypothetical protein